MEECLIQKDWLYLASSNNILCGKITNEVKRQYLISNICNRSHEKMVEFFFI